MLSEREAAVWLSKAEVWLSEAEVWLRKAAVSQPAQFPDPTKRRPGSPRWQPVAW